MSEVLFLTTTASIEEVNALRQEAFPDANELPSVQVLETDSLIGDPQTIIAIATAMPDFFSYVRSICSGLIDRNRGVRIKLGEVEVEVDNVKDLERVEEFIYRIKRGANPKSFDDDLST